MTEVIKYIFVALLDFTVNSAKLSEKLYDTAPITINQIYQVNTNYWVHTTKPYKNNPKDK